MSTISLDQVKAAIKVTHDQDDDDLERLLASAEAECKRYCNRSELPTLPLEYVGCSSEEEGESSEDPVAPDVANGIILMVRADYDGDPTKRDAYRSAAETLWTPYRTGMGV